jgi:hypothetical protein
MILSIFKICSPNTHKIYLGATTKQFIFDLFQQYQHHYNVYKKSKNKKLYRKYFEIFDQEDAYFVLVDQVKIQKASEMHEHLRKSKIDHHERCVNFCELIGVKTVRKYKRTPKKKKCSQANELEMSIEFRFPAKLNIKIIQ